MQKQFAMPVCAHTAGKSLSPTDSDCGTKRNGARAGGRGSRGHAQRSEVKQSEPDGVRPVLRRAVCDFQQRAAEAERTQSAVARHFHKFAFAAAADFETICIAVAKRYWETENKSREQREFFPGQIQAVHEHLCFGQLRSRLLSLHNHAGFRLFRRVLPPLQQIERDPAKTG